METKEASTIMPKEKQEDAGNSAEVVFGSNQENIPLESDDTDDEQLPLTVKKETPLGFGYWIDQKEKKTVESIKGSVNVLTERQEKGVASNTEPVSVKMEPMEGEGLEEEMLCQEASVTGPSVMQEVGTFSKLVFREPCSSSSESCKSIEQKNFLGLEDNEELGTSSSLDCKRLSPSFLNATEEGRLKEVDLEKAKEGMLLDPGSSVKEVSLVKASYVPQMESDKEQMKQPNGVNEIRLKKALEASLVQVTSDLENKKIELERSSIELKMKDILIQKIENDLVKTKLDKVKEIRQHHSVALEKDNLLKDMTKEKEITENKLDQAQKKCQEQIRECEDLQIKLKRQTELTDRLKGDIMDADIRLALTMVKGNDLEEKVKDMQKEVEELNNRITNKDVDLQHKITLLVNMTKENMDKECKINEYCRANYELAQQVQLKIREVGELKAIRLVDEHVKVIPIQESLEEKEAKLSALEKLKMKLKSLKRKSEDVLEKNSKVVRLSGDHRQDGHSLGTVSSLPFSFPEFPCLSLPSRPSSPLESGCTPPNTKISPPLPGPTASKHQSLSQAAPLTHTTGSQPSFLRVRDINTLLHQELHVSPAEKEDVARIRLKHEVAEHVKLYLQPYKQHKQSEEALDFEIWKISTNED